MSYKDKNSRFMVYSKNLSRLEKLLKDKEAQYIYQGKILFSPGKLCIFFLSNTWCLLMLNSTKVYF